MRPATHLHPQAAGQLQAGGFNRCSMHGNKMAMPTQNTMKSALPIFLVMLLTACATSKEIDIAEGQRGYSIDCSADHLDWSLCYEKAGKICGAKGFEILDKTGGTGIVVAGVEYGVYGESDPNRSMIIKCRNLTLKEAMTTGRSL